MSKLIVISLFFVPSGACMMAADNAGPLAPKIKEKPQATAEMRVDVNMVLVPISVMDQYGRSVLGLSSQNFEISEGGRRLPIASFVRQDQAIAVGLIFDCSGSMKEKFRLAREAPRELFQQLNPDDESFLVTVSNKAELRQPLTSQFQEVENSLLFTRPSGTTSLIDGIYLGLQQIRKSHNPRRALLVVSDGGENDSRYTMRELERIAIESDTQICAAGLYEKPMTPEEVNGPNLMNELCRRTGGTNFIIPNVSNLHDVMTKVGVTLHNQYVLGYYPSGNAAGKYHKIQVHLLIPAGLPPLMIHARAGYFAPGW